MSVKLETIVSFAKRRGFIFQSADIYGGLSSCYDYGPLGVEFKNNIKNAWKKEMIQERNDVVGLDSAILSPEIVWEASGHLQGFSDPLVECKVCHHRFRADHLLEAKTAEPGYVKEKPTELKDIVCPDCSGELTEPQDFNLMMKTELGVVEGKKDIAYLRGETCQGIFLNYKNVLDATRQKVPFGIAQVGKAFRNEITTKHFIFRMKEFEQMEMQYFVDPINAKEHFEYWKKKRMDWYLGLGLKTDNLRFRQHELDERAHYALDAWDIEYNTPWSGWEEMEGIHNRGDWDLSRHSEYSKTDLNYHDQVNNKKFTPFVIETSGGADRAALMFLADAYEEVETRSGDDDSKHKIEVVLRLHKDLAPIKVAILPLSKKEPLQNLALEIQDKLKGTWMTQYDETGSIGKRYRRQDEIGTPYCLTVDFDSLEDGKITVRDRDTMEQERVLIVGIKEYFNNKFNN